MMKGYDDNQKLEKLLLSPLASTQQTFTSHQMNKTLSKEQRFIQIWMAVHKTPFLYSRDRLTSEIQYLMRIMKCGIHLYICTLRLS